MFVTLNRKEGRKGWQDRDKGTEDRQTDRGEGGRVGVGRGRGGGTSLYCQRDGVEAETKRMTVIETNTETEEAKARSYKKEGKSAWENK